MKERGGVWGGGRFGIPPPHGPRRMTGSAARTLVVSSRWEFFGTPSSLVLWSKIIFYEERGGVWGGDRFGVGLPQALGGFAFLL